MAKLELKIVGGKGVAAGPPAWVNQAVEGSRSFLQTSDGGQWYGTASRSCVAFTGSGIGWQTITILADDFTGSVADLYEASDCFEEPGPVFRGQQYAPEIGAWLVSLLVTAMHHRGVRRPEAAVSP